LPHRALGWQAIRRGVRRGAGRRRARDSRRETSAFRYETDVPLLVPNVNIDHATR
jgi:hypothetical protein